MQACNDDMEDKLCLSVHFSSWTNAGSEWPDKCFTQESATLYAGAADEPTQKIGELQFQVIDVGSMMHARESLVETFDIPEDLYNLYCAVYGCDERPKPAVLKAAGLDPDLLPPLNDGVLYLKRLQIEPTYQGRNLGLVLLREVLQKYRASAGLALLRAYPLYLQDRTGQALRAEALPQARKKLYAYYRKLGFARFARATGEGYMVRSTEAALPEMHTLLPHDWARALQEPEVAAA